MSKERILIMQLDGYAFWYKSLMGKGLELEARYVNRRIVECLKLIKAEKELQHEL